METIQDTVRENHVDADALPAPSVLPVQPRRSLPPKGSCWYCEKPLDNVRRFCGKQCADGFDDEAAFSARSAPA